jgi:hypothetical protein
LGGGTTLVTAFRLSRQAIGCELALASVSLSLRRLCSNLVPLDLSVACVQFSVDPPNDSVDRSKCVQSSLQLVQRERRFYFIGRTDRRVIFSVLADSLDDARQKFRASGRSDFDALFIIKTETRFRFMAHGLLKFLRPFPGSVKNRENAHLILFYPVCDDEPRARNDQFSRASHAPLSARHGMPGK